MSGRKLVFGIVVVALLGAAKKAPPTERVVGADGIAAVTLNGQPGRLRVDPGAPGIPLVSTGFAARAGLKSGKMGFGLGYSVGPVSAYHSTAVARIAVGGPALKKRVGWGQRPYAAVVDGTISPADLPEPVIRFVLRDATQGERTVTLPMVDGGGLFGGFSGLFGQIMVRDLPMRVRFDPYRPHTHANASAALRLAAAHDGRLAGATTTMEIAFGIERPVRAMTLARPLAIGPLGIAALAVRTSDNGNASRIADGSPAERPDPDEVVVTAKGRKPNPDRDRLTLGADALAGCSSIVFDKPARVIRLTCG